MINIQRAPNDILTLVIENKDEKLNLINETFLTHFETLVEEITRDNSCKGLIITSGKRDFLSGIDLKMLSNSPDPISTFQISKRLQSNFRKLESWGKPVVAAINGNCLGAGLELVLACHYRIAINHPLIKFGLPGVKIGLMPCAGGTQRLSRLIGIKEAIDLLINANLYNSIQAKSIGLIHSLADTNSTLMEIAMAFIEQNPIPSQPWENLNKSNSVELIFPSDPNHPWEREGKEFFIACTAKLFAKNFGSFPAPQKIIETIYEGSLLDLDNACEIESRNFAELCHLKTTKSILSSLFFGLNNTKKVAKSISKNCKQIHKIGIIGCGKMGKGIAEIALLNDFEIVIKDKDLTATEMVKNHLLKKLKEKLENLEITEENESRYRTSIHVANDYAQFNDCDLIIETINESFTEKKRLLSELSEHLENRDIIIGSNTSMLPLEDLKQSYANKENIIGLHFFSPVSQMNLIEIVKSDDTSQSAIEMATRLGLDLKKIPIIINNQTGFFTTRVFSRYISEALMALSEGVSPEMIENAGLSLGFPLGPLAISDELSLNLIYTILKENYKDSNNHSGQDESQRITLTILKYFVENLERFGKQKKKGFYDYTSVQNNQKVKLIARETKEYAKSRHNERTDHITFDDLKKRFMAIQIIEALKCVEEGILNYPYDADIGSILGWGFPSQSGGVLGHINQIGLKKFADDLHLLKENWGDRFAIPKILKTLINKRYTSIYEIFELVK